MIGPSDAFIWGSGGAQLTPTQIDAQRKVAQAMMAQGSDYSPVQSWTQGAARVAQAMFGGMMARDANEAAKTNQAAEAQLLASALGGVPSASSISTAPAPVSTPMGRTSIPASTNGKIYSNDEPSPLDPPSGADRDAAIRTVLAEAGDQGPVGLNAVASVIRNRAVNGGYGGDTPSGVVTAPNQFEPWNTAGGRAKMAAIDPNGSQYAAAGNALDLAYAGNDPTNGATMFYGPKTQAALGRRPPAWDDGTGVDIGGHRFFGGAPRQPVQVADNDPAAIPVNAQPTQGFAIPGQVQAQSATLPALIRARSNLFLSEGTRKLFDAMIVQRMEAAQKAADPLRRAQLIEAQSKIDAMPLDRRAKELAIAKSERELQAAPTVQRVKQPDGSEVAVQWDAASGSWVPLKAPEGGNPVATPKLTEQQSKDVGFFNRGQKLLPRLEEQDQALTDPASTIGGSVSNYFKSDKFRQAEQTGRELLAVILRKDTGAAVTPQENELYSSIYLPKPGDDAATIQQKRAARQTAIEGLRMGLGTADIIFRSREAAAAAKAPTAKPATPEASQIPEGATATNPDTGETIIRKNGKWVPLA